MCYNVKQMDKKTLQKKIGEFWEKYETKIVLIFGFLLISVISFEFGLLYDQKWQQSPIIIEKPATTQNSSPESPSVSAVNASKTMPNQKNQPSGSTTPAANCAFVGSKNSNKYHLPTCQWVKRIKPENIICFASAEDAVKKGYLPDKGCVK